MAKCTAKNKICWYLGFTMARWRMAYGIPQLFGIKAGWWKFTAATYVPYTRQSPPVESIVTYSDYRLGGFTFFGSRWVRGILIEPRQNMQSSFASIRTEKKHHGLFWHTSVDPQLHLKDKDYWILEEQNGAYWLFKEIFKEISVLQFMSTAPRTRVEQFHGTDVAKLRLLHVHPNVDQKKLLRQNGQVENLSRCHPPKPKKTMVFPAEWSIFGGLLCHKPRLRGGKTTIGRSWWSSYVRLPGEFWSNTLGSSPTYLGETQQFKVTGWWFGAFFIFHNILGIILPHWFSYFSEG